MQEHPTMTEPSPAPFALATCVASQALLRLTKSMDKAEDAATPPEVKPEDRVVFGSSTTASLPVRPDTNPHEKAFNTTNTINTTITVSDEDNNRGNVTSSPLLPRAGKVRRKIAKRTFHSPPLLSTTLASTTRHESGSPQAVSSAPPSPTPSPTPSPPPSPPLPSKSSKSNPYPMSETAAIIESEMSGTTLEDFDMAAPMLLYSLSTSSKSSRKRKQREEKEREAAQVAAKIKKAAAREKSEKQAATKRRKLLASSSSSSSSSSAPSQPQPKKNCRTRAKPRLSLKKQESILYNTNTGPAKKKPPRKIGATARKIGVPTTTTTTKKTIKETTVKKSKEAALIKARRKSTVSTHTLQTAIKTTALPASVLLKIQEIKLPWELTSARYPELTKNDVLSGRGNGIAIHSGNRQFRQLVLQKKQEYISAYRNEKGTVAADVIRMVLALGGRFVERDGRGFKEIDFARALEKTSQALRENSSDFKTEPDVPKSATVSTLLGDVQSP